MTIPFAINNNLCKKDFYVFWNYFVGDQKEILALTCTIENNYCPTSAKLEQQKRMSCIHCTCPLSQFPCISLFPFKNTEKLKALSENERLKNGIHTTITVNKEKKRKKKNKKITFHF